MATVSAFSVCRAKSHSRIPHSSSNAIPQLFPMQFLRCQSNRSIGGGYSCSSSSVKAKVPLRTTRICSATEEDGATAVAEEESAAPTTSDQTVSVSVSPSDVLTMFFQVNPFFSILVKFLVFSLKNSTNVNPKGLL